MADSETEALLAEMRETMAQFRLETAEVAAELAADRRADAAVQADLEQARRNGDHGREWQAVQQSIDMRKTTLADVINGVDHSPEAVALRAMMAATLPKARSEFATTIEESDESGALGGLQQAQSELALALEQLNRLNLDVLNPNK